MRLIEFIWTYLESRKYSWTPHLHFRLVSSNWSSCFKSGRFRYLLLVQHFANWRNQRSRWAYHSPFLFGSILFHWNKIVRAWQTMSTYESWTRQKLPYPSGIKWNIGIDPGICFTCTILSKWNYSSNCLSLAFPVPTVERTATISNTSINNTGCRCA